MAASIQCLSRSNISNLTKIIRFLCSNNQLRLQSKARLRRSSTYDIDISKVKIPKKIHREPTDILRALSATVERDGSGPDYCFIDDPFVTSFEHHIKKKNSEAIASGRKAARYIIDNYPKGFLKYRHYPERYLPTCEPKQLGYKIKNPCEEALKERIRLRKVKDAINVYELLKSSESTVSLDTKLDLLDLLCVYNCREPPVNAIDLEKLYSKFYKEQDVAKQPSWRNNVAELLFKELPKKTARAYNTLLQGRAEHGDKDGAEKLHREMISSKIPVDLESYHKLIRSHIKVTDSMEPVQKLLIEMESNGIKPTVKTFEAVLNTMQWMSTLEISFALKVFSEMNKLNIEPNLGCFCGLINIVYKPRSSNFSRENKIKRYEDPELLHQVVDYLNANYVFHEDNMETYFSSSSIFVDMMAIVENNLQDVALSEKFLKFYDKNPNYVQDRGSYLYSDYFKFLISNGDIHKVMKEYKRLVPYTTVMKGEYPKLLSLIMLSGEYHYFLDVWNVLSMVELFRFLDVVNLFFSVVGKLQFKDELQNKFCNIIDTIVEKRNKTLLLSNEKFKITFTAELTSNFILVYLNGNQLNKAWNLFVDLSKNRKKFHGFPIIHPMYMLASTLLEEELVDKAMEVISFMNDEEMPIPPNLIARIHKKDKKEARKDSRKTKGGKT